MDARTRKIIEEQTDPRILQALLSQAVEHIEMQKGLIDKLQAAKALEAQSMFGLEERVKLLVRQIYGKKSEERNEATDWPRDKSQEEVIFPQKNGHENYAADANFSHCSGVMYSMPECSRSRL